MHMKTFLIYHNPRCTKSRESLKLLQDRCCALKVKLYLEDGLDAEEIQELKEALGLPIREFIRSKEPEYKVMGLSKQSTETELAKALEKAPKLLERPIIVSSGKRAVIGRPVEITQKFIEQQ